MGTFGAEGHTMSEMGGSYDPGPWSGFDYKDARKVHNTYDSTAGRGYGSNAGSTSTRSTRSVAATTIDDYLPASLTTNAKSPLVVIVDGTGSMGEFPEVIFKKLPLLDLGIADYLDDCEISFAMVGDAGSDYYALQAQPFSKGKGLEASLNKLKIERGGGSNEQESYDLAALYYARNVEMPKAVKPILIYVCDEGIYPQVDKEWAKDRARVDVSKNIKTQELFQELAKKYSVYCIRKHYGNQVSGEQMVGSNLRIHQQWESYVGADRIAILNNPNRVVDVIFGLVAYDTGKTDFFEQELKFRQKPEQVQEVMKSMVTVGVGAGTKTSSKLRKSIVLKKVSGKASKSLL